MSAPMFGYGQGLIQIAPATMQAAVTGHSYWITRAGGLVDAGANDISTTAVSPPEPMDLGLWDGRVQWSLFYGAQTSLVGARIGYAELWPVMPVENVAIKPYVKEAATHWMQAGGLGFNLQQSIPTDLDVVVDQTSQANVGMDVTLSTEDYVQLLAAATTAGTTQLAAFDVDDGGASLAYAAAPVAAATQFAIFASGGSTGGSLAAATTVPLEPGRRTRFTTTAAGVATTARLRVLGKRRGPHRMLKVAPYISFFALGTGALAPVVPTVATTLFLELYGVRSGTERRG